MTIKDIETRSAEIREEMTSEDADLKSLIKEARELKARKAEIIAEQKAKELEAETRKANLDAVVVGKGEIVEKKEKEEMTEVRSTKEYADAYAKYVIGNAKEEEVRALLTVNGTAGEGDSATVPVPTDIDGRIRAAWERDGIVSRISKSYIKGNVAVGYEVSATGAVKHTEGDDAPDEEQLVLGTVDIIPEFYKKWILVSDRAIDIGMGGTYLLNYLYDEFENKITKALADGIVAAIGTAGAPFVSDVAVAPSLTAISQALATLADDAPNPVIIMNRATEAAFTEAFVQGNFAFDPFRGLPVVYNNTLPAITDATEGDVYAIVGDLSGVKGNFPNGDEVKFIFDEYTYAEKDLIKIVGKILAGIGVVQPSGFCTLSIPEE